MTSHPLPVGNSYGPGESASHDIVGAGIGLRACHIQQILNQSPCVPWFELLGDNHFAKGGLVPRQVEAIRKHYPLCLHFVGMNIAGTDPLDYDYLDKIKDLIHRSDPSWISDHLCFTAHRGRQYHDLLPIPYTEEALDITATRILRTQEYLNCPLVLENVSAYLRYTTSGLTEAEFLAELVSRTDCGVLLDVNNLYVNHINHGDDTSAYLQALPLSAVREIHLAGYENKGTFLLDTHNHRVSEPVWRLFEQVIQQLPEVPTLIEWDTDIPEFSVLYEEATQAEAIRSRVKASIDPGDS